MKYPLLIIWKKIAENNKLVKNFSYLSLLQISNYLFPLITFPYLVRVLGPEKFGLINFASAFAAYFIIITDYGFNLSATREISINRENKNRIDVIFSSVLIIKFFFLICCLGIFFLCVNTIYLFKSDSLVYIFSFGFVIGNALFPVWFFQGMEKMKYITLLNVVSKAVVTALIFILITREEDYVKVVLLNSGSFVFLGICSLFIIKYKFGIKIYFPEFAEIKYQLKEGLQLFISSVSINLYTTSTTFILGLFANNTVVGYFAAADKIRSAFQSITSIISQTIYPHISNLMSKSISDGLHFIRKIFFSVGGLSFIISLTLFLFAEPIINIVLGSKYYHSIPVLRIISWLIFIIAISNITGIQTMLNLGMKKTFMKVILGASIVHLIISFILVPMYLEIGSAVSVLVTESIVTLGMVMFLVKKKVYIMKVAESIGQRV